MDPLEVDPEGQVVAQGQNLRFGIADIGRGEVLPADVAIFDQIRVDQDHPLECRAPWRSPELGQGVGDETARPAAAD